MSFTQSFRFFKITITSVTQVVEEDIRRIIDNQMQLHTKRTERENYVISLNFFIFDKSITSVVIDGGVINQ